MTRSLLTRAFNRAPIDVSARRATLGVNSGVPPAQDVAAQLAAMTASSTLFAVVDRIAGGTSSVNWRLWRTQDPGASPEDRIEVTRHPALVVWDQPNQHYTSRLFVETSVQHYDLAGETWWIVGRAAPSGVPLELWPVRPDRMRPIPSATDFIAGYIYRGGGQDVPLSTRDVIYGRRPNPTDPYRGMSPVGPLLADLRGGAAAAQWNANFFNNSARPDGVIEVPEQLSDAEFDQMVARWREQHQGASNAHRVAVLERASFKPVGFSAKDMDFVNLRGYTGDQIREAFGISKFMLGGSEGVNRATAVAAKAVFYEQTIVPRLDFLKELLNTQLLPLFGGIGQGVEFDHDPPKPDDPEAAAAELAANVAAAAALIDRGADPAETLAAFGLPDLTFTAPIPTPPPPSPPVPGAEP